MMSFRVSRRSVAGPTPKSAQVSHRMARVRQKGTDAELDLRSALHAMGLRYRVQVPLLTQPRRVADIVFPTEKIAVFVDGCFWHGCPQHASWPKNNADFWRDKIEANRARDADTNRRLDELGWTVIRVWAHDQTVAAADRIARVVFDRRRSKARPA
jgi:DNA mismatch endonuclease, patch repair protein